METISFEIRKNIRTGANQAKASFINKVIDEEIMKGTVFTKEFLSTKSGWKKKEIFVSTY